MKHEQILYILKFKKHALMKVGITCNLRERIRNHQENFNDEFDLLKSYVITAPKGYVGVLEKQILNDLINDIPESVPFENCVGSTEIRLSRNLRTLIDILNLKSNSLDAPLQIFKGIDLSGFQSDIIPEKFYPHDHKAHVILDFIGDIVMEIADERNQDEISTVNELLYEHFIVIGLVKEEKHTFTRKGCFVVPHHQFPSKSSLQIQ